MISRAMFKFRGKLLNNMLNYIYIYIVENIVLR